MKRFIKENIKVVVAFVIGILVSTTGVIAATILTSSEVSYNGNKVPGANTVQEAIDTLYTKASSGSDCRNGYQKQVENGAEYSCGRIARQCEGNNCTVCIRAERLHTELCNWSSYYCSSDGYSSGGVITYGNQNTTNGVLNTGDAFDCDVNGDGTYDSNTERFYYVTTKTNGVTTDTNTAVLIYYSHTKNGEPSMEYSKWHSSLDNSYGPTVALTNLPTESQWSNVQLSQTKRTLTDQNGSISVTDFSYEGYSTRLLTFQEVNQGCYDGTTNIKNAGGISTKCQFLLERTTYANNVSGVADGPWLESTGGYTSYTQTANSINSRERWVRDAKVNSPSTSDLYGARPVIEVSLFEIEY